MTARRRSAARKPVALPPPPREHYTPPWFAKRWQAAHHVSHRIAGWVSVALAGDFRIPRFQRPWFWTDEQILRLFDSLLQGYHVGTMTLWERYRLPPSRERFGEVEVDCAEGFGLLVVDGQQRLGAIVTAACSGRFWFDLQAGAVVVGSAGPWRAPLGGLLGVHDESAGWLRWIDRHAAEYSLPVDQVADCWGPAKDMFDVAQMGAVRMDADWTADRVVESFRRINIEGTRIEPEELRRVLQEWEEEGR